MPTKLNNRYPKFTLLVVCLALKSTLDVLIIGGLALAFYYSAFSPSLRGALDEAGPEWITGWVVDLSNLDNKVEVQLYIDGEFSESRMADFPHPGLVTAGVTKDERHGFLFFTPPLDQGQHEARVYAAYKSYDGQRRTLVLLGKPIRFRVENYPAEPYFKGWLETANAVTVKGWAIKKDKTSEQVEVRLYIDGHFVEMRTTDDPGPDFSSVGLAANEKHGFVFFTPSLVPGEHEARVFAVRKDSGTQDNRSLRIIGRPIKFTVE